MSERRDASTRTRQASRRRPDEAHFLVLAGLVLVLAFLSTGFAWVQVHSLEASAMLEPSASRLASHDWGVTRLVLVDEVPVMVPATLTPTGLDDGAVANLSSTFAAWLQIYGQVGHASLGVGQESQLLANGNYDAWSVDGARRYTHMYDGIDDGALWRSPCPASSEVAGCIVGVLLVLEVIDVDYTLSEPVLYTTN